MIHHVAVKREFSGKAAIGRCRRRPDPDRQAWDAHAITTREDGTSLIWIDRHLVHDGSFLAFDQVAARAGSVAHPELTFGIADHYVPTRGEPRLGDGDFAQMLRQLEDNTARAGIRLIGLDDPRQGIVHVVAPEQGLTLPGLTIVCGDSHTSTHGASGPTPSGSGRPRRRTSDDPDALAEAAEADAHSNQWGARGRPVGQGSGAAHYRAHWGRRRARPRDRIRGRGRARLVDGRPHDAVQSRDRGGGAPRDDRAGEATFEFLRGRAFAPKGDAFERAVEDWRATSQRRGRGVRR